MKLTVEQIRQSAHGVVEVAQTESGAVRLYRLSAAQRLLFKDMEGLFYQRAGNSSGVKLMLQTDSPQITLDMTITSCSTRKFFSVDVYADEKPVGYIDHLTKEEAFGDYRQTFALGAGSKTVSIYLPWSATCEIRAIELAEGSTFAPVKRNKTMLAFGDSITQGFDSFRSAMSYTARIADWLEATCYNKGVGSAKFMPSMLEVPEDLNPDYITVAYGTNDWCHNPLETFRRDSRLFLQRLSAQYPNAKIFVLAPIWRKDLDTDVEFGPFSSVYPRLCEAAADLPNTVVIDCFGFIPQEENFYQDKKLHPNDEGFAYYGDNLTRLILPLLEEQE